MTGNGMYTGRLRVNFIILTSGTTKSGLNYMVRNLQRFLVAQSTKIIIEPVYRLAEQEWKDFIDEFTASLTEVDPQIPPLPTRDVIHRIYRDVSQSHVS
jgi:hypothetical protein